MARLISVRLSSVFGAESEHSSDVVHKHSVAERVVRRKEEITPGEFVPTARRTPAGRPARYLRSAPDVRGERSEGTRSFRPIRLPVCDTCDTSVAEVPYIAPPYR